MKSAENLVAVVEGDITQENGVLKITHIRLKYHFAISPGMREKADRVLAHYADLCPAYQSIKGCIKCSWEAVIIEE